MTAGALRLSQVFYVRTTDGAYVLTPSGARRLTGASVAAWLDRLAPFLDGTRTVASLLSSVPEDRKEHLGRLLGLLVEHGVVTVDSAAADVGPSRLVVIGQDEMLAATARAAAVMLTPDRVHTVDLAPAGSSAGTVTPAALMGELAGWSTCQPVELDELAAMVDSGTAVVHIHSPFDGNRAEPENLGPERIVSQLCQEHRAAVTDCVLLPDQVWILPADGPRRSSALARWRSPISAGAPRPAQAGMAVAGAIAVQAACRPPSGASVLVSVHLESMHSSDHRVLPHPFEQPAWPDTRQEFIARVARSAARERIPLKSFSDNMAELTDTGFGIVDEWAENDYVQQPLRITSTRVVDPTRPYRSFPIVESGVNFEDARHRAALRALADYSWRILDPRRLNDKSGGRFVGPEVAPADALDTLRGANGAGVWVWCNDLRTDEAQLVEAVRVFEWLTGEHHVPPRGVAAGYSWAEALCAGLLDHCVELVAEAAGTGALQPRRIDLDSAPLDDLTAAHLRLLERLGHPVQVYDLTAALEVPAFAFCMGNDTVAYRCGLTATDALRRGVHESVLTYQARVHGQADYAPAPCPQLPTAEIDPAPEPTGAAADLPGVTTLISMLERHGFRPAVVPLDHDPVVNRVMPNALRVVLL
jgi:hypothetical protein